MLGVGLHDLHLIALALVAAIAGIRVGRVLQRIGADLLGRFDFDGAVGVERRIVL